jgi:type IV secretory pathway VirB10-like protein
MQPERPQGTWADLKVPTATSSYQQDMSRVVTMDRVITAVLIRPYDSRSSQQVVAQVDRNVYGAHGRNVLIPRGSQIIGTANGGGERVAIQWKQIIRPDGARFMFDASAADAMGQAGVPGRTNQRLLKRYGAILLGTVFKAGVARVSGAAELPSGSEYGQPARNNGAIVSDLVRQDLEKIMADIVQRNSAVQPIITVPAGTRITVVPTMDLQMRPMQARVEEVRSYPRRMNGGAPAPSMPDGEEGGDVTQPRNARRNAESPLPSEDVPATGNTPPWDSN